MAEKQIYPMISEKSWWTLRNQFKKTIPSIVNVSYLKSLLSLNSDQSARNIMAPLKQMKILDSEGKPGPRATDWRSETKYAEVCAAILAEIYPTELLDLFPDSEIDTSAAKSWFMDTCSVGDNAAAKFASTFALLKNQQAKLDADMPKTSPTTKKIRPSKMAETKSFRTDPQESAIASSPTESKISKVPTVPTIHIDLQIHISPDASTEQIDSIFASIAKHLYAK